MTKLLVLTALFLAGHAFAQALPDAGSYSGTLQLQGSIAVPLEIEIKYTNDQVPGDPEELFTTKKKMIGSFIVNGAAGPFSFAWVDFNSGKSSNQFEFKYSKSSNPNDALTLDFVASYNAGGKIAGTFTSILTGEQGRFTVQRTGAISPVAALNYSGEFHGTFHYTDTSIGDVPLVIKIAPSTLTVENPDTFELKFTNGYAASFVLNTWEDGVSGVFIDYLRNQIHLVHEENGRRLEFIGSSNQNGLSGRAVSTFGASIGTFDVQRVASSQ